MRIKWWMIPLIVVLILVIVAALFWQTLVVFLAPKTVLTAALTDMMAALDQRTLHSPVRLLAKTADPEGKNTITLELDTSNELLGSTQYNMTVQTEFFPRRFMAYGRVTAQETALDLSVYLDSDFAALSSSSLLQGNFYGMNYSTFSQDIRKNSLIELLIGDETIRQWEEQVTGLQTFMNQSVKVPQFSREDIQNLMLGIFALKAEVSKEKIALSRGTQECFKIHFQATGEQIKAGLDYAEMEIPFSINHNSVLNASFFLIDGLVVRCTLEVTGSSGDISLTFTPDLDPWQDRLTLNVIRDTESLNITVDTTSSETVYSENIHIDRDGEAYSNISYAWNYSNGDLQLVLTDSGEEETLALNLSDSEGGFRLETSDFEALMHALLGTADSGNSPCALTVTKGADFATPEYKNFDQWSMEDMLTLFGSIGSLLGLKIG